MKRNRRNTVFKNRNTKTVKKKKHPLLETEEAIQDDITIKTLKKKLGLNKKGKKIGDGLDDLLAGLTSCLDSDDEPIDTNNYEDLKRELEMTSKKDPFDDIELDVSGEERNIDDFQEEDNSQEVYEDISLSEEEINEEKESDEEKENEEEDIEEEEDSLEVSLEEDEYANQNSKLKKQKTEEDDEKEESVDNHVETEKPKPKEIVSEPDQQLVRLLKGHVNRLTYGNFIKTFTLFEETYSEYPRQHVNDTLAKHFVGDCIASIGAAQTLTYSIIYAGMTSLLHRIIGPEVGGTILEKACKELNNRFEKKDTAVSKNLILLISHLYNFGVIHCILIYDIINYLLEDIDEMKMEVLLLLIRTCGHKLKKDDSSALKQIIEEVNVQYEKIKKHDQKISKRLQFLISTLNDLKSTKLEGDEKKIETQIKSYIKSRFKSGAPSIEQLRIKWNDIISTENKGRYWMVGSAFQIPSEINQNMEKAKERVVKSLTDTFSNEILKLAKQQRMNTDVRKSIFCILLSSEDYLDAFEKIMSLKLQNKNEREIARVIVHCCQQERVFNPYYLHLAIKFCSFDHSHKITFKFVLWDKIKEIDNLSERQISNIATLYGQMITEGALNLNILKVIEFDTVKGNIIVFLNKLFEEIFNNCDENQIRVIFTKLSDIYELEPLRLGIEGFFVSNLNEEIRKEYKDFVKVAKRSMNTTFLM